MKPDEIIDNLTQKYQDAMLLYEHGRYANAVYLAGYAVELALKYAMVARLGWAEFNPPGTLRCLKVHDFSVLLRFSGQEAQIKRQQEWSRVVQWSPETRYHNPVHASDADARALLAATRNLVEQLCKVSL